MLEDLLGLLEPLGLAELVEESEAPDDLREPARGPPGTHAPVVMSRFFSGAVVARRPMVPKTLSYCAVFFYTVQFKMTLCHFFGTVVARSHPWSSLGAARDLLAPSTGACIAFLETERGVSLNC